MPFGLKMSKDVFQMHIDQVSNCIPSMIAMHVDIGDYGQMTEE